MHFSARSQHPDWILHRNEGLDLGSSCWLFQFKAFDFFSITLKMYSTYVYDLVNNTVFQEWYDCLKSI